MRSRLFAILILSSWAQVQAEEPLLPDPPGQEIAIGAGFGVRAPRHRKTTKLTLIIPEPPRPAGDEDPGFIQPPVRKLNLNAAILKSENFDRVLFGEETETERRSHLNALLMLTLGEAVKSGHLTFPERQKLLLAGRGDIKRFFDLVEDRRREFEQSRRNFQTGFTNLRRLADVTRLYQDGPFGEGSLFAKTLRKIEAERKADNGKADVTLGL